jgi:autotransporter-associated beta strand protein
MKPFFAFIIASLLLTGPLSRAQTIEWDTSTQRFTGEGSYGRIARLANNDLLLVEDFGGQTYVRRSTDNGVTWSPHQLVGQNPNGIATNGELLAVANGSVLALWNDRPTDGVHNYRIRASISADGGHTWGAATTLYTADTIAANGCWEPAAVQLPSGQIQVFFANENNFRSSDEQEITRLTSNDNGLSWTAPQRASFRPGYRDGMPVPSLLKNGHVAVSIEDSGLSANFLMKPTVVDTTTGSRWGANVPPITATVNAGATYLRQFPTGVTVLSTQSDEGASAQRQVVYVGDANAQNSTSRTIPFTPDSGQAGLWNSLFIKNAFTVTGVSGTTIGGQSGLWTIDGYLVMPGNSYYFDTTENTSGGIHLTAGNAIWSPTSAIWAQHIGSPTSQARWYWGQGGASGNAYFVADGASNVTISGALQANSLTFYGTGYQISGSPLTLIGEARITSTVSGAGTPLISAPLAGSNGLVKTGPGNVVLSGANTYGGGTTINEGAIQFNAASAIAGSSRNVIVNTGGIAAAGYPIDNAFLQRIASTSAGVIALGADSNNPLDLSSDATGGNFTAASLGAVGSATYGGTLTPNGSTYRFGGGGGRLTIASALSGNRDVTLTGPGEVVLAAANTHSGVTRLSSGTLTLSNAKSRPPRARRSPSATTTRTPPSPAAWPAPANCTRSASARSRSTAATRSPAARRSRPAR